MHFLLWICGRLRRMRVTGDSMLPTLEAGAEILVDSGAKALTTLEVGDVVVLRHPSMQDKQMVKRLAGLSAAGYSVLGDNPKASTDSRLFGPVPRTQLVGRVISRFP